MDDNTHDGGHQAQDDSVNEGRASHQAHLRRQAHPGAGAPVRDPMAYLNANFNLRMGDAVGAPFDGADCPSAESNPSGWSVVETNGGTPPSARSLHAAAYLNGVMYVFGGYTGISRVNTFHAFSFAEKRWSPVLPSATSSQSPRPRDRHVAFAFGNSFYVHGGFDGTARVSDFWCFDFSSMTWREVVVLAGVPPSPRHSHSAVVHRHSLYIFGGYDGSYK